MSDLAFVLRSLLLLLVLAAPLPLLLALLKRALPDARAPFGSGWLLLSTGWWATHLAVALALGLSTTLGLSPLLAIHAILLAAGLWLWRRPGGARLGPWLAPPRRPTAMEASALLLLLIPAALAAWRLWAAPTDNFDAQAYHLPFMLHWVHSGGLGGLGDMWLYPSHLELLGTVFFLPLGQDLWVGWPGLLAWLHAGLALFVAARVLKVATVPAMAGAVAFLCLPDQLARIGAIQPDTAVAALLLTGLVAGLLARQQDHPLWRAWLLVSLGLLLGFKLSAPAFVLFLLAALALVPGRPPRRQGRWPRRAWAGVAVVALLLGAGWYARNLAVQGNPFSRMQVEMAGRTLLDGPDSRESLARGSLRVLFDAGDGEHWAILLGALRDGLGPAALLLPLLALLGTAWLGWRRALAPLLLAIAGLALWWNAPWSADNGTHGYELTPWMLAGLRYGYAGWALLALLAAAAFGGAGRRRDPLALAFATALSLYGVGTTLGAASISLWLAVGLALAGAGWLLRGAPRPAPAAALLAILLLATSFLARPHHEQARARLYGPVHVALGGQGGDVVVVNSQELQRYTDPGWERLVWPDRLQERQEPAAWLRGWRERGARWLVVGTSPPRRDAEGWSRLLSALEAELGDLKLVQPEEGLRFDERLYRLGP